ncbi:hypothetical protein VITFI_CDS0834 [Vitreoscilla filiformis]|uniref:Uncharacterized protein n=1 Tax=Vitreoscilla filiformis TaxID=63 RepID=A0A221KC59_VITFI|nr:hypothetical protein VITFI_CDS0834 [Vitreoscilla filiformis]
MHGHGERLQSEKTKRHWANSAEPSRTPRRLTKLAQCRTQHSAQLRRCFSTIQGNFSPPHVEGRERASVTMP